MIKADSEDRKENKWRRKSLLLFAAAALLIILVLRIGYLYVELGKIISVNNAQAPSVFYGRPLEIRKGDHLGNIHFTERLNKLSYKKVVGKPAAAGTYAQEKSHIRIFLRGDKNGPVEMSLRDGRVASLTSSTGKQLESIRLEPEEIGRLNGTERNASRSVSLADISPYLQNAVIASQDPRFYRHVGFDIPFIGCDDTITQQLARDLFLSPRKAFARGLRAAELAEAIELRYPKKQILEMYLNKIYLGHAGGRAIYGVENAAAFYFSKHAKNLSLEEAALLAGIIDSPNRHTPFRNIDKARDIRDRILSGMRKRSMIGENEFRRASKAPARIQPQSSPADPSSYFMDYIQRVTKEELGTEKFRHPGYHYYTTLDPVWQDIAQEAVAQGIAAIEQKAVPSNEPLQAALVAVDPKTGELVAMMGGRSYAQTRFNRAVDAKRQPGSAFKPFVLLAALSQSLEGRGNRTLSTLISGEPVSFPTPEGLWSPSNFEDETYGNITIRTAIEHSVNTATTRLAGEVGFAEVLKTARLAGITSPLLPIPSMVLGSFEVTPMELAYAYTTMASGGIRYERFPLFSVAVANGDEIITRMIKRDKAFDPRVTWLAGYALEGVLVRGTAADARSALGIDFPASGKTGTTNGNKDSWFVGYTQDVVCAVWVGYDSGADTGLTGADGALHIWTRFMRAFYSRSGPAAVMPPRGIETAVIDPRNGYLATKACPKTFVEAYLAGTAPKKTCPDHPVNPVTDKLRKKIQDAGKTLNKLFQ